MSPTLPPGQHRIEAFPRFGLPAFATRWPTIPDQPTIEVRSGDRTLGSISLEEIGRLPRVEQTSDLHCVTTWSACGLRWSGYRMKDVLEQLIAPMLPSEEDTRYLLLRGLDGARASLLLSDALAPDVILADRLDGEPLSLEHGAPLRVVAPAHYAYKSVKHLCAVELRGDFRRGLSGSREHPRARVALEERGVGAPGWLLRRLYRPLVRATLWYFRRAERSRPSRDQISGETRSSRS